MATNVAIRQTCARCETELRPGKGGGPDYHNVVRMQNSGIPLGEKWCERCYDEKERPVNKHKQEEGKVVISVESFTPGVGDRPISKVAKAFAEKIGADVVTTTLVPPAPEKPTPAAQLGIRCIPIEQIMAGHDLQMRVQMDAQTVADYVEWLDQLRLQSPDLRDMPPIVVFSTGQKARMTPVGALVEWFWLADGFHRLEAWKTLRTKAFVEGGETFPTEIPARVLRGDQRDAILYAAGANAVHGLRRTAYDKRRAVETLLKDAEWAKWSDNEIARRCHVAQSFVSKLRGELSLNSEISEKLVDRTYTTKHGTVAKMKTAKIGKSEPFAERLKREEGERDQAMRAEMATWPAPAQAAVDEVMESPSEVKPPAEPVFVDEWDAGAVGLERDWTKEELDAYVETHTVVAAHAEILAAHTPLIARPDDAIPSRGQGEYSGAGGQVTPNAPPISDDSTAMRIVVERWLLGQDALTQRRLANELARFGIHADCWPDLKLAFPLGVAYVPDELRRLGAEALARLDAPPPSITLQLERRQAEVLYVAIQRHMIPSLERNELIELLSAALGLVRQAEAA